MDKRKQSGPMTEAQRREIEALVRAVEAELGSAEATAKVPAKARRGVDRSQLYRPVKDSVSWRIDRDVIAWLKKDGPGYQTRANRLLRELMVKDLEGR